MTWNTKIPKFRRFVLQNFPFIEQDFDALTDYQLICKVVEYLNKVIDSQNQVIDQVSTLTDAFNELQSFVDNYFDNLDVQEEINNKLDAMVEEGTLQEIITTYIQANVAWIFDTVADMKASTNLINGSYARTLGFYSIDDGGGATYYITDSGTANEKDVIAVGALFAHLVYGKQINVLQLGAYADDTHDDSGIINYAMTLAYDIVLPKGIYLCANTINIGGDVDNNFHFNCKGTIHTTANNGVVLIGSYDKIFIDKITGRSVEKDNNLFTISTSAEHNVSGYNWIEIGQCNDCSNGIILKPTQGGISYNEIKFIHINATNACVLFQCDDVNSSYVTENHFTGGRVIGAYGVKMVRGAAQTYNYGGNLFDHVGFEGVGCGVHLEFAQKNNFMHSRMSESLTGSYWIECDVDSHSNKFNAETLAIDKVNDLNNVGSAGIWQGYNEYTADHLTIDGKPSGSYVRISNNKVYADSQFEFFHKVPKVSTYNTVNATLDADYYFNSMTIEVGGDDDANYTVDVTDGIIRGGLTDFYIWVKNLTAGSTLALTYGTATIIKSNNFSGAISNKIYHIVRTDNQTYFGTGWAVVGEFKRP